MEDVAPRISNESIEIKEENTQTGNNNGIEIKEDINTETPKENNSEKGTEVERNEDEMIVVDSKVEEPKQETPKKETSKEEAKPEILKKEETKQETPKQEIQKKEPLEENEDVFYFDDDTENTQKQENKNQKSKEEKKDKDDKFDLEDEYFDFDGF